MLKTDGLGMQRQPGKGLLMAVPVVPKNRMAQMLHVHPQLVRTSCLGIQANHRPFVRPLDDPVKSQRLFTLPFGRHLPHVVVFGVTLQRQPLS